MSSLCFSTKQGSVLHRISLKLLTLQAIVTNIDGTRDFQKEEQGGWYYILCAMNVLNSLLTWFYPKHLSNCPQAVVLHLALYM